jgi:hypothetical protein
LEAEVSTSNLVSNAPITPIPFNQLVGTFIALWGVKTDRIYGLIPIERDAKPMEEIAMSAVQNTGVTEVPNIAAQSLVANRLLSERQEIWDTLIELRPVSRVQELSGSPEALRAVAWRRELLEDRLRKIDEALDRLMTGSYGSCATCGRWIQDTKLEIDPAAAYCIDCWERVQT